MRVERVSPNELLLGEMLAMITVFEFPPNESQSKKVSLESQYGMCLVLPSLMSTSELMTFPRADKLLLIIPASFNHSPPADVSLAHSDPAKSIIWNRDTFKFQSPSFILLLSIIVVSTE